MSHMQGLKEYGLLSPELTMQLEKLETKHQESLNSKALSHAHLKKLHRVRNQTNKLAGDIKKLDDEWANFLAESVARLNQHAEMYQAHRSDLLQQFTAKIQELTAVKAEVSNASQSLVNQVPQTETPAQLADLGQQIQAFRDAAAALAPPAEPVTITSEGEGEDTDTEMGEKPEPELIPAKAHLAPRPFKTSQASLSPTTVRNHQLKHIQQRTRQDKKETKENKDETPVGT